MGVFDTVGKAVANVGRGIAGIGYRLGAGAMIAEMEIPPGLNYESYLRLYGQVGWLFGSVSLISESVADSNWRLYRTDQGGRKEIENHAILDLLGQVNRFQTLYQFIQLMQMYIELVGEAFIVLNFNRGRIPVEMWLAPPQYMTVVPSPTEYISHYLYRRGAAQLTLEIPEVIHIMNPNPLNPYRGLGVAQSIGVDLDSERYATRYTNRLFYNDATPGLMIEFPTLPPKPQREELREEWNSIHQGWRNARKTGFLWGGAKANTLTMTNRDMDFWRLRKINRETVLGAFRIPTSLMGLAEVGSRARAEADEYIFAKRVIKPALKRIRESLNEQLCTLFDERLELDYDDPVPENVELMATQTREDFVAGLITREEARETRGYDRDAPKGDTFLLPMNLIPTPVKSVTPLQLTGVNVKLLTEDRKYAYWRLYVARTESQERLFIRALKKLWADEEKDIIDQIEQGKTDIDFNEDVKVDKFREEFEPIVHEIYASAMEDVIRELEPKREIPGGLTRQAGIIDEEALEWIGSRSLFLSKSLVGTTRDKVRKELATGFAEGEGIPELTRRIRGYFDDSLKYRAPMTARTETIAASNEGALKGYEKEKIERVEYLLDYGHDYDLGCECEDHEGKQFAVDEAHSIIPVHPNCRCTWVPVIGTPPPEPSPSPTANIRDNELVMNTEHDAATWTRIRGRETCRAFDREGKVIFKKNGGKHTINYYPDEMRAQRGAPLQVHTHPNTSSFSGYDFVFAASADVKEAHVVTSRARFIMTPKGDKWDSRLLDRKIVREHNKGCRALRDEYFRLQNQGVSKSDALEQLTHAFNTKFAAKYNINYSREVF